MGDVTMNKKVKIIILIASAIAIVATILTIVFVQNLKDPEGIREYEMDGYKYKIELMNDRGNEACFFIPQYPRNASGTCHIVSQTDAVVKGWRMAG